MITMKQMIKLCLQTMAVAGVILVALPNHAHSFDGQRKGFVLGFGVGPGFLQGLGQEHFSRAGFQTDVTIGIGINDQLEFHYTGKQFWYYNEDLFFSLANPLVGLSYYLKPQAPSAFLSASAGLSIGVAPSSDFVATGGPGFHIGCGFEFARGFSTKFDIVTSIMIADNDKWNPWNFILSVNILGY
jgi:hypothetical protein